MNSGTRILLVEDNRADRELVLELLADYQQHRLAIRYASTLAEAKAALADDGADCILLDLGLPDSYGMETVREVRAAAQDVPIVVLTGLDDEEVGVAALQEGAQDFLAKGWMSGPALVRSIRYAEERNRVKAELIRTNAELEAGRERLKRAQEIAHLGSWELVDGRLTWSDEVYRIHGIYPQEIEPTYDAYLAAVHPEDRGRVDAAYRDSVREGRDAYELEYRILRWPDGAVRTMHERCTHRRSPDGSIVRSEGIVQDVTEWKEAEETLKRYAAELERSNADLQRFAYVASHDLQAPLRNIISFSQLLERRYRGQLDTDADEFIGFIVEGCMRMQSLIQDLLLLSRVTTQARPLAPTDTGAVVADALQMLEPVVHEAGASVTVGELPAVMADEVQLGQVFSNLVGNAIKYRREGVRPEVRITARRLDRMVEFSVADNGIGIEPEHLGAIFEMFRRLHTHDEYEGTGIGLALVKKIAERHGGEAWAESVAGEGSTFSFTLPIA